MKKSNSIKIFVSHRKDLVSNTIENPLYVNVICGAELGEPQKGKIGDNTGDNISTKQPYYSEYTVQYWAWKNCKADYYGLCHYRRYLSFADELFPEYNEQRVAKEDSLTRKNIKKFGLLNPKKMKKEIKKHDLITSITYDVRTIPQTPQFNNVYEAFVDSPGLFTTAEQVENLKNLVKEKFPIYYEALIEELNSELHRGFNCFVMKKELFHKMCEFQFGIMFEIEKNIDLNNRVGHSQREVAYLGEILYGTFIRWVIKQNKYKVKEKQIVLFLDTKNNKAEKQRIKFFTRFKELLWPNYRTVKRLELSLEYNNHLTSSLTNQVKALAKSVDTLKSQNANLFFSQEHVFSKNLSENKLKFWQSYPKATGDLRIIQEANATMLRNFKKICESLNADFWLHGGSLIGGLRHSGFVPWDDDIDIAMMRKDFLAVKKHLEENSNIFTIREYYYFNLGCRSYRFMRKDIESNCFVDIFVYDNYNLKFQDILIDWKNLCNKKLRIRKQMNELCKEFNLQLPSNNPLFDYPELKTKLDILFDSYIKNVTSEKESEHILWNLDNNYENETRYAWHHGRIFAREDIFPFKKVIYEGMECNIPNNFEKYAIAEYGYSYLDMPTNFGQAIHFNQYFGKREQIEFAEKIIEEGIL